MQVFLNGLVAACEPAFNLLRLLDGEKGNVTCLPTTVLQMCMFSFIAVKNSSCSSRILP